MFGLISTSPWHFGVVEVNTSNSKTSKIITFHALNLTNHLSTKRILPNIWQAQFGKTCCCDRTCRKPMEETPNYIPNKTSVIFSGNHNTFKQNIPWTPRNAENLLLIKLHEMSLQSSMLSWKPIHQCAAWSAISRATNVGSELLVTLPEDLNKNAPLGNYGSK